jgi:hypothetical protein
MLTKTAWRILTVPDSLCAKGYERMLLSRQGLLARKPRTALYTWRSLLHGRDLLYQGVQWGIGNGRSVKITGDNWIPNFPPDRLSSISPIPSVATVHCLMEDEDNSWNYEDGNALFEPAIAEQIM